MPSSPNLPSAPRRVASFDPQVAAAFGQAVRELRVAQSDAQDQFAVKAGVDRSYYGKLERGERQPSLALILRIASALEVSAADLVAQVERRLLAPIRRG